MSFWNIRPIWTALIILSIGMLLFPVSLEAQHTAADDAVLTRSVIGAGAVLSSGSVNLVGTIGQPITGVSQAGGTNARLGFWPGIMKLPVGIGDLPPALAQDLQVTIYPVPVTGQAQITYRLQHAARVSAQIHDLTGRTIARLCDGGTELPGSRNLVWNGKDAAGQPVPAGVYFIRIEARGDAEMDVSVAVKPLLLIR